MIFAWVKKEKMKNPVQRRGTVQLVIFHKFSFVCIHLFPFFVFVAWFSYSRQLMLKIYVKSHRHIVKCIRVENNKNCIALKRNVCHYIVSVRVG